MDKKDLPVEIRDMELPYDDNRLYKGIDDERQDTSSGFVNALFLGAVMVVCFMWGMLVVILR